LSWYKLYIFILQLI